MNPTAQMKENRTSAAQHHVAINSRNAVPAPVWTAPVPGSSIHLVKLRAQSQSWDSVWKGVIPASRFFQGTMLPLKENHRPPKHKARTSLWTRLKTLRHAGCTDRREGPLGEETLEETLEQKAFYGPRCPLHTAAWRQKLVITSRSCLSPLLPSEPC